MPMPLAVARYAPPDLAETRQALAEIVKDGKRAGEVIHRIRGLIRKERPRKDNVEINAVSKLGVPTHWGVPTGLTPPALANHKSCRGPLIDSSRPIGFSRCSIIGTKSLKD